jgi:hypothetical protein
MLAWRDVGRGEQMSDETTYSSPEKLWADASELQKFARCFTKDWRLHSDSFIGIANGYIQQLPPDRKAILESEFRAFLYESKADSDDAILQLWYAQGAEAWDFNLTVRPVMSDFYWLMNPGGAGAPIAHRQASWQRRLCCRRSQATAPAERGIGPPLLSLATNIRRLVLGYLFYFPSP